MTQKAVDLLGPLRRLGLVGADEAPAMTPLTGGVSSDIWAVQAARGTFCVKRALARLKVAADWRAPVERNANEVAWIEAARAIVPGSAPEILGHAPASGLFAMAYLPPESHRLWKAVLHGGEADPSFAAAVGFAIGRIHAATAGDPAIAARFATDEIFRSIRLEPYLLATAERHPDLAGRLRELAARTAATRLALVHGDVSPKNILIGPISDQIEGPVFLDAECAWYGDPAFDAAFCLNHLLLKCLWTPAATAGFLACFRALAAAWIGAVRWEPAADAEARAATLLPALALARVDGKSPVEYLVDPRDRAFVRTTARALVAAGHSDLETIAGRWQAGLEEHHDRRHH